jgi:hypothetical protein
MDNKISTQTKEELVFVLKRRYCLSPKAEKTLILDEFIAVSGYHRKHAIRLLSNKTMQIDPNAIKHSRRIYNEAVKEALIVTWEAADRICSKRLKAVLPNLVDAMERHGHLHLNPEVRKQLFRVSASTIDRLLSLIRDPSQKQRRRRQLKKVSKQVPVRTFADWDSPKPGYLEIDFVVHCGGFMTGSFIHTLVATDVSCGWTEFIPLLAKEQSLVVEGLDAIFQQIPFPVLGIDSDNDSAFINDTLLEFCQKRHIEFTRCRAYHKNDQAWIEQKNGAVIRRMVGYERFSGIIAGQALAHLYQAARLYVNYFQPSFKLHKKVRKGANVKRSYDLPTTPCDRIIKHPAIDIQIKEKLQLQQKQLDPIALLHQIRECQSALVALVSTDNNHRPGRESLDQFLAQLPKLWENGEVRPTHQTQPFKPRHWRTKKDPFENVWYDVLCWLQQDPDMTAKSLFERLQDKEPGRFPDGQLRTLQRRVKDWRKIMAQQLVYACIDGNAQKN